MSGGEQSDGVEETQTGAGAAPKTFASGRYVGRRLLGEGGQKIVYLVHDAALDRDCALSLIRTELLAPEELARIRREAQVIARLGAQPHIVTVFDIGEEEGRPYIVCEYVSGGDLRQELRKAGGPLPLALAASIAQDICRGLAVAHKRGIIHRDVKPANVWLTEDGRAKLGDFGLALAIDRSSRLTMVGTITGTAAYMAPEQALGTDLDARTDLYSLGCVLYEMVCGRSPFAAADALAVVSQHIHASPTPPTQHNDQVPRALEQIILRLLAKAKEERPSSAEELLDELASVATVLQRAVPYQERGASAVTPQPAGAAGDVPPEPPPPAGVPAGGWRGERPSWGFAVLAAAVAGAVLLVAGVGVSFALLRGGDEDGSGGAPSSATNQDAGATAAQSPVGPTPTAHALLPLQTRASPTQIAYIGTDGNLWTVNPDGTGKQQLTSHGEAAHPAWAPDARLLAYVRRRGDAAEIWMLNASTKEERLVLGAITYQGEGQTRFASIRSPAWEPTGEAMLYHDQRGEAATGRIRRHSLTDPLNTTAANDTTVVEPSMLSDPEWVLGGGFDLSASGDRLAFEVCSPSPGGCGMFTMPSEGADRPLVNVVPLVTGEFYGLPALSPDAGRIAFHSYPGTPQSFIEVVTGADLRRQRLAEAYPTTISVDPFWPKIAWSPDGTRVCYETLESGSRRQLIMVQDAQGGPPRELVEGRHPTWAP